MLGTQFNQNVLADEENWTLPLTESQMAGVLDAIRDAAAAKAAELKIGAPFAVTLSRSSVEPVRQYAEDRTLREQLWRACVPRGDNANAHNNSAIMTEMLALRAERASLWATRISPPSSWPTAWRARRKKRAPCWRMSGRPRGPRSGRARRVAGSDRARRRQFPPVALGLALLRVRSCARRNMISTRPR